MPRVCHAVITLALLALLAGGCRSDEVTPPSGDVASALAVPTMAGGAFDPTTLRGRPSIVLFWRVGCQYCMNELPVVSQIAKEHGVPAVAVMVAGDAKRGADAVKQFDGATLVDDGSLRAAYHITLVPYLLVLHRDGTAAHAFLGEQSASTISDALNGVD